MTRAERLKALEQLAAERILILDGASGTIIQTYKLDEADYRGDRFADWPLDVKGNNDLLNITKPEAITKLHEVFLEAGADIIETNTFSSTTIAQADYHMEDLAWELNEEGAKLARAAADAAFEATGQIRFVAGALGPTNRTASISPDVNDPGARNVTFEDLRQAYVEQTRALIAGGADLLLVETIFDTLNAKAALFAVDEVLEEEGVPMPVMISGTITDASGRTLSGQTTEAFWNSLRHAKPFSIGLNCALGAEAMRPYIAELARISDCCVSAYPNAGLPNEMGEYDETPGQTSGHLSSWAKDGLVNIVGGCCGTTPEHIAAIRQQVDGVAPRKIPELPVVTRLSGLEPMTIDG